MTKITDAIRAYFSTLKVCEDLVEAGTDPCDGRSISVAAEHELARRALEAFIDGPAGHDDGCDMIVSEVSRNWPGGHASLLSEQFELLIRTNAARGFKLDSWQLNRVMVNGRGRDTPTYINETIIAVFRRVQMVGESRS